MSTLWVTKKIDVFNIAVYALLINKAEMIGVNLLLLSRKSMIIKEKSVYLSAGVINNFTIFCMGIKDTPPNLNGQRRIGITKNGRIGNIKL